MTLILVTENELINIIQEKIFSSEELDGDCKEVKVNSIQRHESDETGNNWDVHYLQNATGCVEVVCAIVVDLKKKYNLTEES